MLKSLITRPSIEDPGGVTVYIDSVTSHFSDFNIDVDFLEIGSTRGRLLHPLSDQLAFHKRIRSTRYDLVHLNPSLLGKSFLRDGALAWQAKSKGLPLLVFIHGWSDDFAEQVEKRWLGFFRATFGHADGFIVLASDFANKLRKWGVTAPIYRETTAVSDELIAAFDLDSKLKNTDISEECRILFLARLEREKGAYVTIDACALLLDRNVRVRLEIAGDGSEGEQIRRYAEKKLGNQVQFSGYVRGDAKVASFSNAHLYVMPTAHGEGLPISLLEAMAFGLPVITRPVGGLKDIFLDGKHGFLTEERDPTVIADLIEKMINDPVLWRSMSHTVHEYARKSFVGSSVARELAQIYTNTVEASAQTAS